METFAFRGEIGDPLASDPPGARRDHPGLRHYPGPSLSLSPFTAKRLADLTANIIPEYEARFGPLGVETRRPGEPPA